MIKILYRNIFLGREDEIVRGIWPLQWLDRKRAKQETRDALRAIGINIRHPEEPVVGLSGGERPSIAIARAVHFSAKLLILDEPTSALSLKQAARVLKSTEEPATRDLLSS